MAFLRAPEPTRRRVIGGSVAGLAVAVSLAAAPPAAQAAAKAPKLTALRCVPATLAACKRTPTLAVGDRLQVRGSRLVRGQQVSFKPKKGATKRGKLVKDRKLGLVVTVPAKTAPGSVSVTVASGSRKRSNALKIKVVAKPVKTPKPTTSTPTTPTPKPVAAPPSVPVVAPSPAPAPVIPIPAPRPAPALPTVFTGAGEWIWFLKDADGGNVDAIAARVKAAGMSTLFIKAADGKDADPQYTGPLVDAFHARGLRVCGWQVVYGGDPGAEAAAAVASKATGQDCFVVNAEDQYANRYAQARQYVDAVRAGLGNDYPVGFTSHAYVDAHASVPYSVFLGPGGAQANLPQVYWKEIGGSVDAVTTRTIATNRIYDVPMAPIGQGWNDPSPDELRRFRAIWAGQGVPGVSWWRAEITAQPTWNVLNEAAPAPVALPDPGWPSLKAGDSGDLVRRLQTLLVAAGATITADGQFGPATLNALRSYQAARALPANGQTDATTWQALIG
ncbi:MAG: peptidoglycan-binding domain-containing protein [Solirubrobacteraceae bacterium]|nr:peptidoglycan-binding domain-containing protein [Solirubrobacteraceae bacterium]